MDLNPCVSKDDVRLMVNHPSDKLILEMVERVKAYFLTNDRSSRPGGMPEHFLNGTLVPHSNPSRRRPANKDLETQRGGLVVAFQRWTDSALELTQEIEAKDHSQEGRLGSEKGAQAEMIGSQVVLELVNAALTSLGKRFNPSKVCKARSARYWLAGAKRWAPGNEAYKDLTPLVTIRTFWAVELLPLELLKQVGPPEKFD